MSLKSTARAYLRDALTAFHRAPTEVALSVLSAVLFSYAVEERIVQSWLQFAIGIYICFAFAWAGTLLHALGVIAEKRRWLITALGALGGVAYLLLIDNIELQAEQWRALLLVSGVTLLVLAAPAWIRADSEASLRLRRINSRFLLRAIGIALYGLALFAGLALALAAIDTLFELKLDGMIYTHVLGWIIFVLVPWVVVGGLLDYVQPLEHVSDITRVGYRLISFLVPPLIVLYYLILIVYAVRILITGEVPKNLVSPMVIAAGLLTALATILFDPEPADARNGPRILRVAPLVFIPLVPLGLWALMMRIDDYGWTEFRILRVFVLVLLLGLAGLGTVQLLRRRPFAIRVIPLVLGAAFLLAAIGPWSVLAFARRDQQARLAAALRAAQVDPARPARGDTARRLVPREQYDRINNIAFYLQQHFGAEALGIEGAPELDRRNWSLTDYYGLVPAASDSVQIHMYGALPPNTAVPIAQGARVYRVNLANPRVQLRGRQVAFMFGGELLVDLDTLLRQPGLVRQGREQRTLPAIALPVRGVDGQQRGELVVFEFAAHQRKDSTRIDQLDGILILR